MFPPTIMKRDIKMRFSENIWGNTTEIVPDQIVYGDIQGPSTTCTMSSYDLWQMVLLSDKIHCSPSRGIPYPCPTE